MRDKSRGSTTVHAKTTRPEIGSIVRRGNLFARLDGAAGRTVAWISGPAGAGKSTLAASYVEVRGFKSAWYHLDPDDGDVATFFHYLRHAARRIVDGNRQLPTPSSLGAENIASYSRKFFRHLFEGVKAPAALVLDNLNYLAADGLLCSALEAGLTQVPRHCCVVVTSRNEPPAALARMRAGGEMVCIDADDLRVTLDELTEIAGLRGKPLALETAVRLQERTEGWAAGVVLMLEHAKIAGEIAELDREATPKVIFDYLAGEIFDHFPAETQQLLLRIACLPRMTAEIAREISGVDKAGRILLNLVHNDYFVNEVVGHDSRIFQLHPLLQDFVRARAAADLPEAVGPAALARAAALLRDTGQFEDAVALFVECKDWSSVAAIALNLADEMLADGRRDLLAGWLELLPPEMIDNDPQLLQALAASRMYTSPRTARHQFEKAYAGFRGRNDTHGMIRSCCGIIDATVFEFDDLAPLDRWMEEFQRLSVPGVDSAEAAATIIRAMLMRNPGNPAFAPLLGVVVGAQARSKSACHPRIEITRAMAELLRGDFVTADTILGGVPADPADPSTKVGHQLAVSLRHFLDGEFGEAQRLAGEGIATADAEGINSYQGWLRIILAAAALGKGDLEEARNRLRAFEGEVPKRGDRAIVHYLRGWLAAIEKDVVGAQREIKIALLLASEVGSHWIEWFARLAMAQAFGAAGSLHEAESQVRSAMALAERLASPLLQMSTLFVEAAGHLHGGNDASALTTLRSALSLGRVHGFRHVIGLTPALLARLYALALRNDIETEYARNLVGRAGLAPPPAALRLRQWPWTFQIMTFGGFKLLQGAQPIEVSARASGRPAELLKVLVALGGSNVRADTLAEALWPRIDADYASRSLSVTIHRLRTNVFETEGAVIHRDGRISLNTAMFRIDTWALEQLMAEMDAQLREPDSPGSAAAAQALADEALSLYRGPFLQDDAEQPSYIACREQVRSRLLRVLARSAKRMESAGLSDAAIDCYLRCIDADDLCEAFYRNLMMCHQRRGEIVESLSVYERLRTVLAARLKSLPSPETQAVYAALHR